MLYFTVLYNELLVKSRVVSLHYIRSILLARHSIVRCAKVLRGKLRGEGKRERGRFDEENREKRKEREKSIEYYVCVCLPGRTKKQIGTHYRGRAGLGVGPSVVHSHFPIQKKKKKNRAAVITTGWTPTFAAYEGPSRFCAWDNSSLVLRSTWERKFSFQS